MPLRQSVRLGLIVGALFFLSACATSRVATAPARPAPTPPPSTSATLIAPGYEQTGDASWYGHPYHGRRAASGEVYDMNQMTAAHRTLPFGTRVRVESLVDGGSVEVRINDRGPFKDEDKRILDLSYAAGKLLGVVGPGVIPVRLRVVSVPGYTNAAARVSPAAATPTPSPATPMPQAQSSPPSASATVAAPTAPSPPALVASAPVAPLPAASTVNPVATVPAASTAAPAASVPGQTPISSPAQAAPPIGAETTTSRAEALPRPETVPRLEPAPRVETVVRAPAPAPSPPAPSVTATPTPPAPGALAEGWSVQLGAYASEGSAISLRDSLARSWPDVRIQRADVSGRTLWRVRVGNFASRRDADEAAKRLAASGYRVMVVEYGRP